MKPSKSGLSTLASLDVADFQQILQAIDGAIERLHFLARVIRRASENGSEIQGLDFQSDEGKLFHTFAVKIAERRFPEARKSLIDHLGLYIARRREALLRKQRHAQRIAERADPKAGADSYQARASQANHVSTDHHDVVHGNSSQPSTAPEGGLAHGVTKLPPTEASKINRAALDFKLRGGKTSSTRSTGFFREDNETAMQYPHPTCFKEFEGTLSTNARVPCPFCLEPLRLGRIVPKETPTAWMYVFMQMKEECGWYLLTVRSENTLIKICSHILVSFLNVINCSSRTIRTGNSI